MELPARLRGAGVQPERQSRWIQQPPFDECRRDRRARCSGLSMTRGAGLPAPPQ